VAGLTIIIGVEEEVVVEDEVEADKQLALADFNL
jgi:hypothetical protein